MNTKPTVFVTRKLPDAVEDRLRRDYELALQRHARHARDHERATIRAAA